MIVPKDTCLQCGETRETVLNRKLFCATLSGYEHPEVEDEWDRHHWRDWSNRELKRLGIHPTFWDANRRTRFYSLEFVARKSHCLINGHRFPEPWRPPLVIDWHTTAPGEQAQCFVCYEFKEASRDRA